MENKTVKQLREIAKQRGMSGYYKLRKAELITLLGSFGGVIDTYTSPLLNESVPDIKVSPQPTPHVLAGFDAWADEQLAKQQSVASKVSGNTNSSTQEYVPENEKLEALKSKVSGLFNKFTYNKPSEFKFTKSAIAYSLMDYVPDKIKKSMNEKLEALKSKFSRYKPLEFKLTQSAINEVTKVYTAEGRDGYDPTSFMNLAKKPAITILSNNLQTKVNIILTCDMERVDIKSGETVLAEPTPTFMTKAEVVLESTNLNELYGKAVQKILESIAAYQQRGSNWRFKSVTKMEIKTTVYKPLKGSSYIPLPKKLADKHAIINMQNKDNECFKWCVMRALNPVDNHPERITDLKKQADKLDWSGVEFPMTLNQITKFEKNNNNVSINVYGYEKNVVPLRVSEFSTREHVIDLLLIADDSKSHFCLINNLSRLLSSQTSLREHTRIYCRRCLNDFDNDEALTKHQVYCNNHAAVRPELPKPGTTLSFNNWNKSMRVQFIFYVDYECSIKPIDDKCQPDSSVSYTKKFQKHKPNSFCYYIKCSDDSVYSHKPETYIAKSEDDDVAQIFVNMIEMEVKEIYELTKSLNLKFMDPKNMIFTEDDKKSYEAATTCYICERDLCDKDKVRDHCHLTGKFNGAAHNDCSLNYKIPKFIPVVIHNLSGYDSHLFIKKLRSVNGENIKCIPTNEEKYISFSKDIIVEEFNDKKTGKLVQVKRELRFIDSFRFMPFSLNDLTKNLSKDQCKELKKWKSGRQFVLLKKKGVYPYDYMNGIDRLNETELPQKRAFYSKLYDSDISDEDYEHAKEVWDAFKCKTLRDYHELYNISDVLLLADVFENFRNVCLNHYKLDPAWYYTSPGLSWDAMMKKTSVKMELLSDYDMILMFNHGIRGGISTISNRFAHANNKYMGEAFDLSKPSSFITYLDANNLYGWAMCQPLPIRGFQWMSNAELDDWKNITSKDGVGCILEVDLEYSKEIHDLHNDYPLAPERLTINKVEKLIPNLNNKKNYVLHYENLKLYESLGLKITKIHRGIKFEESKWLKEYIDLNTKLRTKATNDFEKDFFKLMNNSVFGKTMENIEKRVDIRLVTSEKEALKLSAKPNYERCTIFDENLIAIHMKRTKLVYNKPIYLGMCILDLSKTLMYDFHYNYIKKKYGDRAKLLFTDTDSLCYEIKTKDFYADIAGDVESRFDTSEFLKDHPSGIKTGINKKVPGMFKDEAGGKLIEEFVGLRAKLYSYMMFEDGDEHKKCKGVKKSVVKKSITHADYKDCLLTGEEHRRSMNVIRSHKHDIYTEEVNKIALSANDDKRVIREDRIHTYAYGHWRLG